ncbi:MAG: hypothetical protein HC779_05745 [Phyllobacteriaceae bacterium]|nr:hypothetical protein [Phyllobacteriaceae bacterium]
MFVTIGVLLLVFGAGFALTPIVGPDSPLLSVIIAIGVWALAEIVTRQRRMRLSSTVLAVMFMTLIAALIGHGLQSRIDFAALKANPLSIIAQRGEIGWLSLLAAAGFVGAAVLYLALPCAGAGSADRAWPHRAGFHARRAVPL